MTFTPPDHNQFVSPHPNLPVLHVSSEDVGPGWRCPAMSEVVGTHWEYLSFTPRLEWKLTAYFTAEGYKHQGRANYRVPASIRAWVKVLKQMPRKLWRHYVKKEI